MKKTHYTVDLSMIISNHAARFYIKIFFTLLLFMHSCRMAAQEVISIGQGSAMKEIVVLPASYTLEGDYEDKAMIKTGRLARNKHVNFKSELEKMAEKTIKEGGNVFQITRIEDHKQADRFRFSGAVYHINGFAGLKEKIADKKKKKFTGAPCAYLTIYRPAYSMGFNDSIRYDITINDTLKLEMQSNTKYILKILKEGNIKVSIRHKNFTQDMNIPVKTGNDYYVRNYVSFPGVHKYINTGEFKVRLRGYTPYLEKIEDEQQGTIESGMVTQIIVLKKI